MVMVYVPAGEFLMGSAGRDTGALANEKPQHTVYLDAFWIDRTEVTVAQFRAFVQASGYRTAAEKQGWAYAWVESAKEWQKVNGADWQHPFGPESNAEDNHPVVQVSWSDAAAYCTWVEGSLPTEAQWEKAARGTDGRIYPWGDIFDGARLNYCDSRCEGGDRAFDDGYRYTAPVGSYPAGASPYDALDMAGNVWEWTADRYDDGYYADSPAQNPAGPASGQYRVLRGGSWNHDRSGMRAAYRLDGPPGQNVDNFGFRCVAQMD
jgi:serine/threonine-protein kinase